MMGMTTRTWPYVSWESISIEAPSESCDSDEDIDEVALRVSSCRWEGRPCVGLYGEEP